MSKMGVGDWDIDQNPISLGPDFALSAESRVKTVISIDSFSLLKN